MARSRAVYTALSGLPRVAKIGETRGDVAVNSN